MAKKPETKLRRLFQAAVSRAHPDHCMKDLPWPDARGRICVVGAGKAAAAMAAAIERLDYPFSEGLVITQRGAGLPTERIEVIEASHPIPDDAGLAATTRILDLAHSLGEEDTLVVLLSGGGSSLLCAPHETIGLMEKQHITQSLLSSGATIGEINCVRKHLSKIKGGQLAVAAFPAPCLTFAISDVAGDDPATIASGPAVPDPTTSADAMAVLQRYDIQTEITDVSTMVETPKPGDTKLSKQTFQLVATPGDALQAAAAEAIAMGLQPRTLSDRLEGTARELALGHIEQIESVLKGLTSQSAPVVLLSGGEATVSLGAGADTDACGGPNQEFALELARALDGRPGVYVLAADTDGRDGKGEAAGAFVGPDTLTQARANDLSVDKALKCHTSAGFLKSIGASFVTGPTHTNVNDFRAILIDPAATA